MRDCTVRAARPEDAPAIAAIHVGTWQHAYRDLLPASLLDGLRVSDRLRMWEGMLAAPRPRTTTLVAKGNDGPVGVCHAGPERETDDPERARTGEVFLIYVSPGEQGRGVGRALMDAACDAMRAHGFSEAVLWVLDGNTPAIAFYERMGWRADGAVKQEMLDEVPIEEVRYRRSLP